LYSLSQTASCGIGFGAILAKIRLGVKTGPHNLYWLENFGMYAGSYWPLSWQFDYPCCARRGNKELVLPPPLLNLKKYQPIEKEK
jgi:hypothetical protein